MKKLFTIYALLISAFLISACDSATEPTPSDTRAGTGSNRINAGDLPGDSSMSDEGDAAGLNSRDAGDNLAGFDYENINPEDIVSTVYFGFDQYAVGAGERGKVKRAAEFFASNPGIKVLLVGHTDWYGTEEYNILLSDKRCKAVLDYMNACGLNSDNVELVGRGEAGAAVDVAKDSPEANHDRRVDIVKLK